METQKSIIETSHEGAITDIASDSVGRKLASGSEDRTIHLWDIKDSGALEQIACLSGHEGPIVQVAWAPHRFGLLLLSCALDKTVALWSEMGDRQWVRIYSRQLHSLPTSIAWCPHEYGLHFACSLASGKLFVFSGGNGGTAPAKLSDTQWDVQEVDAHPGTCTSVSWAPCLPPGALCTMPLSSQQPVSQGIPPQRLVTVGNERSVKVWRYAAQDRHWVREELVRDDLATTWVEVAWAPNVGLPFTYIAAGSDEGFVVIWSQDGFDGKWRSTVLSQFSDRITRLSWSHIGTFLLVSCADETATMWRELPNGEWEQQSLLSSK